MRYRDAKVHSWYHNIKVRLVYKKYDHLVIFIRHDPTVVNTDLQQHQVQKLYFLLRVAIEQEHRLASFFQATKYLSNQKNKAKVQPGVLLRFGSLFLSRQIRGKQNMKSMWQRDQRQVKLY